MPTPQAVSDHYGAQQRLTVATLALTRAAWSRMGEDFDASWQSVAPVVTAVAMRGQLAAATAGAGYVGPALDEIGADVDPDGEVVPRAFAGVASDGRPLPSLLDGAVVRAKEAAGAGQSPTAALAAGGKWLQMAVHTQVADAARGAAGVAIAVRPGVGYVRMLNPPSCSRCAVQAGKRFLRNPGFPRHPRCDCRHIPCTEDVAGDVATDPRSYFDSLTELEQNRIFTNSGAKAIRDGADMGRVVNARNGMSSSYKRLDRIYADDRPHDEVVRALRRAGFVR